MELSFRLPACVPGRTSGYAPRYTSDEWEDMKPKIEQLYVQESRTLQQVVIALQEEFGITASEKQLKSRMTKWGFDVKNVKGDIMIQVARARAKRKRDGGKESVFRVNKNFVTDRKINRYLKRNNVSEEDLLSMENPINAPSPAFSVLTPPPNTPSDVCPQTALSLRDDSAQPCEFLKDLRKNYGNALPDWSICPRNVLIYDNTHGANTSIASNCHYRKSGPSSSAILCTERASITSDHPYLDFRGHVFSENLPERIRDRPDSPEFLLLHFREQICPMLAMTDGENNMWQILVLPLVHSSQSLYHAISAMTALHISTENRLRKYGTLLMGKSIRNLVLDLRGDKIDGTTLTTILILAYFARWNYGSTTGKIHVDGAIAALRKVQSEHLQLGSRIVFGESRLLLTFLADTCSYMDILSRLVHSTFESPVYKVSELPICTDLYEGKSTSIAHPIDPWMSCAGSLFPLMNRAADLCHAIRTIGCASVGIIEEAATLRIDLETWKPNQEFPALCRVHVSPVDAQYIIHIAGAYRHATILYLQQAVLQMPGTSMKQVVREVFGYLSIVPPSSTIAFVQIYPLFVAGCEARSQGDRRWVKERWEIMIAHMRVINVSKCWEITQEVWKRRDDYRQRKMKNRDTKFQGTEVEGMEHDIAESDPVFLVGGRLHWATIMMDLGWEVSF